MAGTGWVDQHHEHEDAEDDDEDDEPARHGAGVLQGQPFVVTSAALCRGKPDSARTRDQICSLASVLQPLAKRAGFLTAREPLKPGSSGLKHVQTRTQLKHTYTQ